MSVLMVLGGVNNPPPTNCPAYAHSLLADLAQVKQSYVAPDYVECSQGSSLGSTANQPKYTSESASPPKTPEQRANHAFGILTLTCVAFGITSFIALPIISEALGAPQKHALKKALAAPPLSKNAINSDLKVLYSDAVIERAAKKIHEIEHSDAQAIREAYSAATSPDHLEQHQITKYKARLLTADALRNHLHNLTPKPDECFMNYVNQQHSYLKAIDADPKIVEKFAISSGISRDLPLSYRTEHHKFVKWADTIVKGALLRRHLVGLA